jgi:hypothetical protein
VGPAHLAYLPHNCIGSTPAAQAAGGRVQPQRQAVQRGQQAGLTVGVAVEGVQSVEGLGGGLGGRGDGLQAVPDG